MAHGRADATSAGRAQVGPKAVTKVRALPVSGCSNELPKPAPDLHGICLAPVRRRQQQQKECPGGAILRSGATSLPTVHDDVPIRCGNTPAPAAAAPLYACVKQSKVPSHHWMHALI
jgi:hypothetical protein